MTEHHLRIHSVGNIDPHLICRGVVDMFSHVMTCQVRLRQNYVSGYLLHSASPDTVSVSVRGPGERFRFVAVMRN